MQYVLWWEEGRRKIRQGREQEMLGQRWGKVAGFKRMSRDVLAEKLTFQ